MRRSLPVCAAALVMGCAAADPPAAGPAAQPAPAVQKLIFLGETGPVLIGLRVLVDGRPLEEAHRAAWDDYVHRLFRHLDRNGDGVLDEREAARAPSPVMVGGPGGPARFAFNFAVIDADGDGRVTEAEFAEYYRQFGDAAFQLRALPPGPSPDALSAALFRLADRDGDGRLSPAEIAALPDVLMARDRDGDELVSADELLREPVAVPGQPRAPRPAAGQPPLILITPGEGSARLAQLLWNRYQKGSGPEELANYGDRPADVTITARLGHRRAGEPAVDVAAPPSVRVTRTDDGVVLGLAGARFELRCLRDSVPAVAAEQQSALLRRCQALRAGRLGPLTLKAVQADRWISGQFALLDRDLSGGIDEAEERAYAEEILGPQARAQMSRAVLLTPPAGRGLFDLLDRNRDGKLGRRELRSAAALLAPYAAADGSVGPDSIPPSQQLVLGLAPFDPSGEPADEAGLPLYGAGTVPLWFRKMDRNRDGDISPKEFLGPREQFRKLDADGDGLISLAEAERAEAELRPGGR
jgi:Ca2+-binding EF-hand superfamily protein